jgi:hypothetical protein
MPASVPRVEQSVAAKVKRATLGTPSRHGRPECRKLADKLLDTQAHGTPPHVETDVLRAPFLRRHRHRGLLYGALEAGLKVLTKSRHIATHCAGAECCT